MSAVVVAYIDSAEGRAALDAGIEEARRRSCRLDVIHSLVGGDKTSQKEYTDSADSLAKVRTKLDGEGIEYDIHGYVLGNSPAEDLVRHARKSGAELIVIGIRRRTATGKLLLGSNALEILHDSDVPVLCVKPTS